MTRGIQKSNFIFQDIARFRTQMYDILISPYGLTTSQAAVLYRLFEEDEQTQSELAEKIKVGTVTLGGLVDRLEARGLVERRADPNDRRANRVCLTQAAYPLGRHLKKCTRQLNDIANAGMTADMVEEMTHHLETVRENLLNALTEEKNGKGSE